MTQQERYGILCSVNPDVLQKLCAQLRDAQDDEGVRRASEALRSYLREQQKHVRERLMSDAEKAFSLTLDPQLDG